MIEKTIYIGHIADHEILITQHKLSENQTGGLKYGVTVRPLLNDTGVNFTLQPGHEYYNPAVLLSRAIAEVKKRYSHTTIESLHRVEEDRSIIFDAAGETTALLNRIASRTSDPQHEIKVEFFGDEYFMGWDSFKRYFKPLGFIGVTL